MKSLWLEGGTFDVSPMLRLNLRVLRYISTITDGIQWGVPALAVHSFYTRCNDCASGGRKFKPIIDISFVLGTTYMFYNDSH